MKKNLQIFFFFISVLVFLCLIYISQYNVFQTDDYIYAAQTRDVGVSQNIFDIYKNWGGRYFSYALNTLIPAGNHQFYWLPKALPVLYFVLLVFGFYKNFRLYFDLNQAEALQKSFILFLFYTVCLSSISEHYFWISGANIYFLPIIFANFLIYFLEKFQRNKKEKSIIFLFLFLLMGSNEFMAIYLLLFLIFRYLHYKEKESLQFLTLGIFGFLLSFLAPGNFNRMVENESGFWIKNAKRIGVFIINSGYVFLKTSLIIPLFIKIYEEEIKIVLSKTSLNKIKIHLIFSVVTLLFSGFVMLLNTGRILEVITFYTLLLSSVFVYYYYKKLKNLFLVSIVLLILPSIPLVKFRTTQMQLDYNLNTIFQEVVFSPLSEYEKEINSRHESLKNSREKEIYVKQIISIPKILYFEELGTLENPNYINSQLQKYYKKEHVYLLKRQSIKD